VRDWRKATRTALLAHRRSLALRDKKRVAAAVTEQLATLGPRLDGRRIGFYWPMKGEIDLVAFVRSMIRGLGAAALPVVVAKNQALEFWQWTPRTKLCNRGLWNIPTPMDRVLVTPDVLLVPLIGFDAAGYRLGYGGGYYDRTLAALGSPALKIGVGHELGRLETIHPQPHDVPMDVIITEGGTTYRADKP
jgi:5-formyltetrahydrofolate cyclo-ligase